MTNNLKEDLKIKGDEFMCSAPADVVRIIKSGIESASDLTKTALQLGDKAPDFSLKNSKGDSVSLYTLLAKGSVILTWYRGGWCPFCNMQLQYLQRNMPEFKANGANLIALTPEKPDESLSTQEKNELEFEVLSDFDNKVAKEYGIVFKLTDEVSDLYKNTFNLNLRAYNGNDSDELPMAATYVIGKDGIVDYAYLNADYTTRAEIGDIIDSIKKLNK